jgi:hypothetical protein
MPNGNTILSVAKAMQLLQLLSVSGRPLTLKEIAEQAELPKSTAFGLLTTMREYDVISQGTDGKYGLGLRLFEYGCQIGRSWDISAAAKPYMEHLAADTGASVMLSICEGGSVITLDQVQARDKLRIVSDVGARLPIYCTSQGKVFLALPMAYIGNQMGGVAMGAAGALLGTSKALQMGLSGFSTTAWALVAAAMFLSAGMMITGLDKRIALVVMSHVGVKSSRLVIGVIFVGFILSFFVPSTTARVSCMVPIVVGIIRAFGLEKGSTFAAVLMMAVAQADSLWNIGIKTAAAQNMVAIGFIQQVLGKDISWLEWFIMQQLCLSFFISS